MAARKAAGASAAAFDAWTATWEEAQAAHDHAVDGPEGAIFQWSAAQEIEKSKAHLTTLDGFDVLRLVASCALHGLAMPDWLARTFLSRYRAVQQMHVDSWDDPAAFGRPYAKGAQVGAMRKRRLNQLKVAQAVAEFVRARPDAPLDPEWERIGSLVAKSDKEAQKLLSEAIKKYGSIYDPAEIRTRLGRPRVPSKLRKFSGRQRRR